MSEVAEPGSSVRVEIASPAEFDLDAIPEVPDRPLPIARGAVLLVLLGIAALALLRGGGGDELNEGVDGQQAAEPSVAETPLQRAIAMPAPPPTEVVRDEIGYLGLGFNDAGAPALYRALENSAWIELDVELPQFENFVEYEGLIAVDGGYAMLRMQTSLDRIRTSFPRTVTIDRLTSADGTMWVVDTDFAALVAEDEEIGSTLHTSNAFGYRVAAGEFDGGTAFSRTGGKTGIERAPSTDSSPASDEEPQAPRFGYF